jgi:hypothetical protein
LPTPQGQVSVWECAYCSDDLSVGKGLALSRVSRSNGLGATGSAICGPMCNLYSLTPKQNVIRALFRVSHNRTVAFEPLNAIFSRHTAPVVRQSDDGGREIVLMSWGFFRLEKGRAPKPVTNVRDDQIKTIPFWRDSFSPDHR